MNTKPLELEDFNKPKRRDGVEFIAYLPDWFDKQGSMAIMGGVIIIAHPEHPPHFWNTLEKRWDEIRPN